MRLLFTLCLFVTLVSRAQDNGYSSTINQNYHQAQMAYSSGNFADAKRYLNTCVSLDSNCFEAYLNLAYIYFEEGEYVIALENCASASRIRPYNAELISLSGKTHYHIGAYTAAETFLKRAISIGDQSADNYQYLGLALQNLSRNEEALFYYDGLLEKETDQSTYWMNRGIVYAAMEEYDKALEDLNKAWKLDPESASTCIQLANVYYLTNEMEQCNVYIELGLKSATTSQKVDLYLLKGNYYRQLEAYEKAASFYDLAYEISNESPVVLTHQAAVLIDMENYETALEKCNAAIALNPDQPQAYFNRGIANEMLRNESAACTDWEHAFLLGSQKAVEYLNGPVCNE